MKRCPNCQKAYDDDKRFCQVDGTPLVDDAPENADPYKTVFGGVTPPAVNRAVNEDDDILQVNDFDPMKTVVSSDIKNPETDTVIKNPETETVIKKPIEPETPKFDSPGLNSPSFGNLSGTSPETPKPFQPVEPPKFDSPFSTPKDDFTVKTPPAPEENPFGTPFGEAPKFDKPVIENTPSPFDPPPAYKEPTPGGFNQSPFGQANDPFGAPAQAGGEWTPPPAPVSGWQDNQVNSNTPFNPPVAGGQGQNNTLAIVSLVLGVLGLCCGFSGIAALITGYMAKNNADREPHIYGGRGMALAGMILGGISIFLMIIGVLVQIFGLLNR